MVRKTRLKRGKKLKKNLRRQRGGELFSSDKGAKGEYIYNAGELKKQDRKKFQEIFETCGAEFGDETPPVDSVTGKNLNRLIKDFIIENNNGEFNIDIAGVEYKFICEGYNEGKSPTITPTSSPEQLPRPRPRPRPGPGPKHPVTGLPIISPIIPPREPTTEGPEPEPKFKPEPNPGTKPGPKPKSGPKPKRNLSCSSCISRGSKKYKNKKSKRKPKKSKRKPKKKSKKTKRKAKRTNRRKLKSKKR